MNNFLYSISLTFYADELAAIIRNAEHSGDQFMFRKFIDDVYLKLNEEQRVILFDLIIKDVYHKVFLPNPSLGGVDKLLLSRYNPDNQYQITYKDSKVRGLTHIVEAFKSDGKYYVSSYEVISPEYIVNIENL